MKFARIAKLAVVRTFRSAVWGRPEGLHYLNPLKSEV